MSLPSDASQPTSRRAARSAAYPTVSPAQPADPAGATAAGAVVAEPAIARVQQIAGAARTAMNSVLDGKDHAVRLALLALLAGGHLLLEDVPGVGKTLLAKSLGRVVDGSVRRIQFTPDLLPSDVLGVSLFNQESRQFEFRAGPVFANIVIADEINRASPKTQSAMLECMAESQASIDGTTYRMPDPFMVVATQNPIDMEGTYSLPEAQRDRFMARISIGYPSAEAEIGLLDHHVDHDPLGSLRPVTSLAEILEAREIVRHITATPELRTYVVALLEATRRDPAVALGSSPRGGVQLLRAAKALAVLNGRSYVTPDDIQALAVDVLAHRVIPKDHDDAQVSADIIRAIIARTPVR
ncbi:MoxR family ATPase [Brevibacterium daeguense]|uniref:MoxR family ATPase n=1 Tax=Brevibacterium daeguense TaxID=909936 RepID=A0ABP8EMT0_9MICO|nr:MoxR family ATPase [Brevibacterium daeguense]